MYKSNNWFCIGFLLIVLLGIITLFYTNEKLWKFTEKNRNRRTPPNLLKNFEINGPKSSKIIDRKFQNSIDFVQKHTKPPSKEPYHLVSNRKWYSQFQQDEIMNQKVFGNKTDGFFLECGALDGETLSNTLGYEFSYGWTGILIEAGAKNYKRLLEKHRKSWAVNVCIDNVLEPTNTTYNSYGENLGFGELLDSNDEKNIPEAYNVTCVPMAAVFKGFFSI